MSLNQNLTTRVPIWNPTDDYYYVNGKRSIKAWLNSVPVWANGVFGIDVDNGTHAWDSDRHTAFTITANKLVRLGTTPILTRATLVSTDLIDFTNYSLVTMITSIGTATLNVSGITGSYYLGLWANIASDSSPTNNLRAAICLSRAKDNFGNASNLVTSQSLMANGASTVDISITEIVIE